VSSPSARPPVRNVALVGHNGNGKTTLIEAMLYRAGVISRPGRVVDGTARCDHEPEERARQQSLSLSTACFDWEGCRVNIIDTPGSADFVGEAVNGLHAAECAVFVVDGVSGVQAQDEVIWRHAERLGLPRIVFVNGLDRDNSSFERTLASLRDRLGGRVEAVEMPIGAEAQFHGIADLVADQALDYSGGQASESPIPDDLAAEAEAAHTELLEDVIESDDDLLEQYLEGVDPTPQQLEDLIRAAVTELAVFPVLCGSALKPIGADRLLDFICKVAPAPGGLGPVRAQRGDEPVDVAVDADGPPLAVVFKVRIDDFLGQISFVKVMSGVIRPGDTLVNSRTGNKERLPNLITLTGAEHRPADHAAAGDIVAVTKLSNTATGDTLGADASLSVSVTPPPVPVYSVSIKASNPAGEDKLATALRRFSSEDPSLTIRHEPTTRQTLLSGSGESHIRVALSRLERLGVGYETEDMRVAYLETLARPADVQSKFKKQTGGHGQFAVASVRFEPLERGAGYEFDSEVTGGAIPRNLIPAVGAGVSEAMAAGGKWGFPLVDLRAVCYDGKHHSVDSSEMSFKVAGSLALKEAVQQAGSAVLEPVSTVRVEVPDGYQGDVLGDLNSRRGTVLGAEPADAPGTSVIHARVPTSEILSYVIDLRSMTGGTGTFSAEHHDYQPLPAALLQKVLAAQPD